jgi:hypothetical protein
MLYVAAVAGGGLATYLVVLVLRLLNGRRRPAPGAEVAYTSLVPRLEELEDSYKRLDRRFNRLQGEFSALTRLESEREDDEEA